VKSLAQDAAGAWRRFGDDIFSGAARQLGRR